MRSAKAVDPPVSRVTIALAGMSLVPTVQGITMAHHDLSHHGKDPEKLRQFVIVEKTTMTALMARNVACRPTKAPLIIN